MKPYKLIACDLDETLLSTDKSVSKDNREAIKKAKEKEVKFVCATGRPYFSMQNTLEEIGLVDEADQYVISYNGGIITENKGNKVIHIEDMDFDLAEQIFKRGIKFDVCAHIYTPETVWIYNSNPGEDDFLRGRMKVEEYNAQDFSPLKGQKILKVLFENTDYSYLKQIEEEFSDILDQVDLSYSSNRYIEFNKKGVNKGQALLKLADLLNIDHENTMAIGDNFNDLAMIEVAALGVGVANTHPDMKKLCDVITENDNDHGAVAEVLEKYVLN